MRAVIVLSLLFAWGCGGAARCSMTVREASQELADGHVTIIGDFTDLEPGIVLTAPDGVVTSLFCTAESDNTSADCKLSGLGLASGSYQLRFAAICLADDEPATTSIGADVPTTLVVN